MMDLTPTASDLGRSLPVRVISGDQWGAEWSLTQHPTSAATKLSPCCSVAVHRNRPLLQCMTQT